MEPQSTPSFVFGSSQQPSHTFTPPASPDPKSAFASFSPGVPVFGSPTPLASTNAPTSPVFQFGSQVPTFGAPASPYASPSAGQGASFVFGGSAQQQQPATSPVRGGATTTRKIVAARKSRQSPAPSPSVTSSLPSSPFAPPSGASSPFSPAPAVAFSSSATASPPPFVFNASVASPFASPSASDKGKEREDVPAQPGNVNKREGEKRGLKGKHLSYGRVDQEQHAYEFKPQLQTEDGRKIVRARRGEPKATKLTAEAAAGRKIIKARRGVKAQETQPSGQARGRACLRHSDLFVRHKVHTNQKTLPMPNSLVIKGYTPNGKYLLTYNTHDGIQHRMWYLWREDDTLKTIHDLKWYGFLPGELLFLTNEFIVFLVPGGDGFPAVVQYTLLDMDLAIKRDFGAVRGRVKLHTMTDSQPLEICKIPGAQAVFAGLLDDQATVGVVVTTGWERDTHLVTTFQINSTGLTELGVAQLPAGMNSSPSHLAVHSFPQLHHFLVTNDSTDDAQSVLFALHPPTVKEPVRVTQKSLTEDERQHLATLEPRVKVVNLAGFVLQMPHPTRPLDIISEDVSEAGTTRPFSLEEFLDFSVFPDVDLHDRHVRNTQGDDEEDEYDDEDDDEDLDEYDDDEDDDGEGEDQYSEETDEEDYPAGEYADFFAGRGHEQPAGEVESQFSMMSLLGRAPATDSSGSLDNVD